MDSSTAKVRIALCSAVNQLISYATTLRSQAGFVCDNIGNHEKLEPWLVPVHSLLYAADQLGLSSLNEFKSAMRALNDPLMADKFVNPEIKQLLSPTPTPYELNIYVLEMCERNNIDLEVVNAAGHRFSPDPHPANRESNKSFSDIERQLAEQFQKQINVQSQGQGFNGPNGGQGFYNGPPPVNPQGGQGFYGGQGGWGSNSGFGPNQGGFNPQGGFGGNQGGFGGQGFIPPNNQLSPPQPPPYYDNSGPKSSSYNSNPYKGLSNLREAPSYYTPNN